MVQLYFLSILFNGLSAYVLIFRDEWENDSIETGMKLSPRNETFRLILGILTAITGLLKLLSPYPGSIPLLGDLIPAVGGIAAGFLLVFGYYRDHVKPIDDDGKLEKIGDKFLKSKRVIGFILLISALLHFLFPPALFL
jgi:hypothetical protein